MASDPLVSKILHELGRVDTPAATCVEPALDQMLGSGGLADLTQHDLQLYLWFYLADVDHAESDRAQSIVRALAKFFALAQMPRYAGIAASPRTLEILRAYSDRGRAAGLRAARQAMDSSGVRPPDLPELQWSQSMGPTETDAYARIAATLELALAAGELKPGGRGWRLTQQRLARQLLTQDSPDGPSLLDRIRAERIDAWAQAGGEVRRQLVLAILSGVVVETTPPRDLVARLGPMQWLLDLAAGRPGGQPGVPMTVAGNLTRWVVQEAADRFGWWAIATRPPRSEAEVWQVGELRSTLQRASALRRYRRRLVVTTRGQALLQNPIAQWAAATATLVDGGGVSSVVGELALIVLLQAEGMVELDVLAMEVIRALRPLESDGDTDRYLPVANVDEGQVVDAIAGLVRRCQLWSLVEEERGPGYQNRLRLSESGHRAAFTALRQRALRPQASAHRPH